MSAEGKKKRGESGKSNAENIAFRYGGAKCDFSTKIGHTVHPRLGHTKMLSAMVLGALLPSFNPSERLLNAADLCMESCTVFGDA